MGLRICAYSEECKKLKGTKWVNAPHCAPHEKTKDCFNKCPPMKLNNWDKPCVHYGNSEQDLEETLEEVIEELGG